MHGRVTVAILATMLLATAAIAGPDPDWTASILEFHSLGSGFAVNDHQILTDYHVVEHCSEIAVGEGWIVHVSAKEQSTDLAVLTGSKFPLKTLPFREGKLKLGEIVVAIGYPLPRLLGQSVNITDGVISSLSGPHRDVRFIQTTAPVQPGNSGGPLIDTTGNVVGIMAEGLKASPFFDPNPLIPQNVNFATRYETIEPFLRANGVAYASRPRNTQSMSVEQLADEFASSVVPVMCKESPLSSWNTR
jgi:S1-C subfamily serine protease